MIRDARAYYKSHSDAIFAAGREPTQPECLHCGQVCPLVDDGVEWTFDGWQWLHHHIGGHQSVVYVPKTT